MHGSLPISIFDPAIIHEKLTVDLQDHFSQSQLLINSLCMRSKPEGKNELMSLSKQIYKKDSNELNTIEKFEKDYTTEVALTWYTKDSFLTQLLNKALRTQNIDILFLFDFFI